MTTDPRRNDISADDIPVPDGVRLTAAYHTVTAVAPTESDRRRGELRQDIQAALTSVRFTGGIFGPRGMTADKDLGARTTYEHHLTGVRRTPERRECVPIGEGSTDTPHTFALKVTPPQKLAARIEIPDPVRMRSGEWAMAWRRLEEMIDAAERGEHEAGGTGS